MLHRRLKELNWVVIGYLTVSKTSSAAFSTPMVGCKWGVKSAWDAKVSPPLSLGILSRRVHYVEKSLKKSHSYRYESTLLLKPLVIRFCPLKFFSDSFRSFHSVNNQNLKESEKIYKGQKRFTKGFLFFLKINVTRFARKIENFRGVFKHFDTV